jgi:hypothetical protein
MYTLPLGMRVVPPVTRGNSPRQHRRARVVAVALLALIAGSAPTFAQSEPEQRPGAVDGAQQPPVVGATDDAPAAADPPVETAPTFRDASGLEEPRDAEERAGPKVARTTLLPLRAAWFVVWAPVRLTAWVWDRFALPARFRRIFFSEDGRLGLFPIVTYKTGFGAQIGARGIVRDVLGERSRLQLSANYGGEVLQSYKLRFRSGRLLGERAELDLRAGFTTFPRSRFFGIGNGDETDAPPATPIDPLRDPTAFATRFYYDEYAVGGALAIALPGALRVRPSGGYRRRSFDRDEVEDDDVATASVYDSMRLVGFDTGLSTVWGELQVALDTMRQPRYYLSRALPSRGWAIAARAGYHAGLGDDPSSYMRLGVDVQRRINLYADDRILALRATYEGVSGTLDEVPFLDLPMLGGADVLRGYPVDRFRDRHAGTATVEYQWGIDRSAAAFLFTDVGRVWRTHDELDQGKLRMSYGGGLQLHSYSNFYARVMVASTIDGGLFLALGLDPLFDTGRTP